MVIYNQITFGVTNMKSTFELFESDIGLLQGEIYSPIRCLLLKVIDLGFQVDINAGITIARISIYLLLFDDDAS